MLKFSVKGENIYKPIEGKEQQIIDAFVSVYGEKYRELIDRKFNEINFISVFGGGEAEYITNKMFEIYDAEKKIKSMFSKKHGLDINEVIKDSEKYPEFMKDELVSMYKSVPKKLSELKEYYDKYTSQEPDNDFRLEELTSRLKEIKIKRAESCARWLWKKMGKNLRVTEAMILSLPTEDDKYVQVCLTNNLLSLNSGTINHEIAHGLETNILKQKKDVALEKSGLNFTIQGDIYGVKFNERGKLKKDKKDKYFYNSLNEIFNDYISSKVTKKLNEKGVFIGKKEVDNERTEYSLAFNLFGNFIDKHLQQIIDCKMSNSQKAIDDLFGYENFNKLAELATNYLNCASINVSTEKLEPIKEEITSILNEVEKRIETNNSL